MERQVDLRGLFDGIRRPWRDRGRNCSSGNVNICCPFCTDDFGYHMAVSEHLNGAYYCYRRPQQHSGRSLRPVLMRLGLDRYEAQRLLDSHAGKMGLERPKEAPAEISATQKAWKRFEALDGPHSAYLEGRGFPDAHKVAARYDLRCASVGKWAKRLLIPMKQGDQTLAWSGRCIRGKDDPKYLTEHNGHEGLIYQPRACRDLMLIFEGQLDALKIAVAGEALPLSTLALTGKQLNVERLWRIVQACKRATRIGLCLDGDTSVAERSRMFAELKGAMIGKRVFRFSPPEGYKDAGALPMKKAERWAKELVI